MLHMNRDDYVRFCFNYVMDALFPQPSACSRSTVSRKTHSYIWLTGCIVRGTVKIRLHQSAVLNPIVTEEGVSKECGGATTNTGRHDSLGGVGEGEAEASLAAQRCTRQHCHQGGQCSGSQPQPRE